jgi:hypothetical protein
MLTTDLNRRRSASPARSPAASSAAQFPDQPAPQNPQKTITPTLRLDGRRLVLAGATGWTLFVTF